MSTGKKVFLRHTTNKSKSRITCSSSLLNSMHVFSGKSQQNVCPSLRKATHNTRSSLPGAFSKVMRETPICGEASNSRDYRRFS